MGLGVEVGVSVGTGLGVTSESEVSLFPPLQAANTKRPTKSIARLAIVRFN